MKLVNIDFIRQVVDALEPMCDQGIKLILVGGCSRAGKSTLSQQLADEICDRGYPSTVLSIDSWIIGIDERPKKSSVLERYDLQQMVRSVELLLQAQTVKIPTYDAKSRQRLVGQEKSLQMSSGYLILEGVLALSCDELRQSAQLSIYVDIEDSLRKQRFESFYSQTKGLSAQEIEDLFCEREVEEVPLIKMTQQYADIHCFQGKIIRFRGAT